MSDVNLQKTNLFNLLLKPFLQVFVAPDELVKDLKWTKQKIKKNMFDHLSRQQKLSHDRLVLTCA